MKGRIKLRINVNSHAIVKLAGLVSNSIILSTNAYLLGANVRRQIKDRKTDAIVNKLQLAAEVGQDYRKSSSARWIVMRAVKVYEPEERRYVQSA